MMFEPKRGTSPWARNAMRRGLKKSFEKRGTSLWARNAMRRGLK